MFPFVWDLGLNSALTIQWLTAIFDGAHRNVRSVWVEINVNSFLGSEERTHLLLTRLRSCKTPLFQSGFYYKRETSQWPLGSRSIAAILPGKGSDLLWQRRCSGLDWQDHVEASTAPKKNQSIKICIYFFLGHLNALV